MTSKILFNERPCDVLLDPNYHFASKPDYLRATKKSISLIKKQNEHMQRRNEIFKAFFNRVNDHKAEANARILIDELKCKYLHHYSTTGKFRADYFSAPRFGVRQNVPLEWQIRGARENAFGHLKPVAMSKDTHNKKTSGTQTTFRESDAQTDPYSPQYTIPIGQKPKVLLLSDLTYDRGLPATEREVELIERAEKRRMLEAEMKNMSEAEQSRIRSEIELEEWRHRAREIEALQEIRLQVIAQLMRIREENRQEMNRRRLDRHWQNQMKKREAITEKIHSQFSSAIRKTLCAMERRYKTRKPDKIELYSNPASQVFAPLTRLGVFPDRGAERFKVRSRYLDSYSGIVELEKFIPDKVINPVIKVEKISKFTKDGCLKREYQWQEQLKALHEYMVTKGRRESKPLEPLRFLRKIEKPAPRPSTPAVPIVDRVRSDGEVAVLHLQRLIRGRALQTSMYESRSKRQLLINELRSTHALTKDEMAEKRRQMLITRTDQSRHQYMEHQNALDHEVLERLDSEALGAMLDLLSKELDRLLVDQSLMEFVGRARDERRMREAEESGRRQRELRRRREQDEYFRQITKVHRDTVDGYFSNLMTNAMETSAELKATKEFEEIAQLWPSEVRCAEERMTHEEEAADLVYNFLIPEVNRRCYRQMLQRQERKFLHAAHSELFGETESGSLSERIRHFESLRIDRATGTDETELDAQREAQRRKAEAEAADEAANLRRLQAHEFDCEDS